MGNDNRGRAGRFTFLLVLLLGLLIAYMFSQNTDSGDTITYKQFKKYVESNRVEEVRIHQNRSVPTGKVAVKLKEDEDPKVVVVSDVGEVASYLDEKNVAYDMDNVQE